MSILSKYNDIKPLFKIDEEKLINNESNDIYIAVHNIYGIVFIDNLGYCINKYLMDVL